MFCFIQFRYVQSGSMLEVVHCGQGTAVGDFDRCVCLKCVTAVCCKSKLVTQAATVTDAWDPSASRCLTFLRTLLSAAGGLVCVITLGVVHRAERLAAREMATFA